MWEWATSHPILFTIIVVVLIDCIACIFDGDTINNYYYNGEDYELYDEDEDEDAS